jgi:hypothetical protein
MEQLVIEQRLAAPKVASASLWRTLWPDNERGRHCVSDVRRTDPSDVHNAHKRHPTPGASTFIIINYVIYGANIYESHALLIPQGVAVSKDGLSTSTLADLQCCLQRRANDTFPVRLWGAAAALESPCMFIESQTPEWLVLKHAWWHH